jgi:phage shock protein PspC (stress-responsive transcriptional regulator)
MNKTLSENIGGIVFHIEEHAYEKLSKYLDTIRGYFTTSDGRDEIIQDIEGRIAEMFQERINNGKQVILDTDVEHVINIMGKPEEFAPESDASTTDAGPVSKAERKAFRRLYRDADDRVIGGVCSGFSHYLGIDPIWLRLAFAISFFVFGSGLLLYIILVIIMPKAKTTAEKLEMKGEQVNISNISKTRMEEKDEPQGTTAKIIDGIGQLIVGFFKVLGKIISVIFIAIGICILIAFGLAFLAVMGVSGIGIPFFITDMFLYPWQQTLSLIGAFMVIGIPIIYVIYRAIRSLFKIKTPDKFVGWSALALWITGVVISGFVVSSVASEFRAKETHRTEVPIAPTGSDTLDLDVVLSDGIDEDWVYVNDHRVNDPWAMTSSLDTLRIESVTLDVVRSNSGRFELVQTVSARGRSRHLAIKNARNMIYHLEQSGNTLRFDESFVLPHGTMYRGQSVQLTLKVPEGKSVRLSEDMDQIIYDIENVTNTYDGDMVGKVWTMTPAGLECISCGFETRNSFENNDDVRIRIDDKGVRVDGVDKGADTTINLDGKDVDIKIHNEGISIESKSKN